MSPTISSRSGTDTLPSVEAILIVFGIYALLALPIIQVQDGLNFALQQQRREAGARPLPYHRVRVWGTLGYMVPAAVSISGWRRGRR